MKLFQTIIIVLGFSLSSTSFAFDMQKECETTSSVVREFAVLRDQGVSFESIQAKLGTISQAVGEILGHPEGMNEMRHRSFVGSLVAIYADPTITPGEVYEAAIKGCSD